MASRDNIYNQILYNKQLYEGGNQGQRAWASSNVNQYYNQLDQAEAARIRAMNAQQLTQYRTDMGNYNQQQQQQKQQQAQQPKPDYSPPVNRVDTEQYRTPTASLEDIASKYGFDYSRDYAAQQAEAEAQAKRDAIANQQRGVDSGIESAAEALDRQYFLEGLRQQQGQIDSGLNAGIAADQDFRMAMARQAALGDVYRDGNLEHMRLNDNLGRVDLERLAREDSLFNERLQQGFENSMAYTDSERENNRLALDALLRQRDQDINQYQFGEDYQLREGALTGNYQTTESKQMLEELLNLKRETEAGWMGMTPAERQQAQDRGNAIRDQLALQGINVDAGWNASQMQQQLAGNRVGQQTIDSQRITEDRRQFDEMMGWNREQHKNPSGDTLAQLDWYREQHNTLSAAQKREFELASEKLQEQKRQFNSEQQWRAHTFNNMSAAERATMNQRIEEFGADYAWREYEFNQTMRLSEAQLAVQAGANGGGGNQYSSSGFLE